VIDGESQIRLRQEIAKRMAADRRLLDELRAEIRPLVSQVRRIQPRSTTTVSLVATDGGNNQLRFDPFLVQLIRVVDSANNEYCLEAITPTTDILDLSSRQFASDGSPVTALGQMLTALGVPDLPSLSPMLSAISSGAPVSRTWIQVYRELVEWAILYSVIRTRTFGTDTLIVFDGLLRSKVFTGALFARLMDAIQMAVDAHQRQHRRRIYLVGIAKHSQVLDRYRLAMALEDILTCTYPAFVEVPREIEAKSYVWSEYARGDENETGDGETNKFVGGNMFLVKFGNSARDPIWPVDIFTPQRREAQTIIGHLLANAQEGFPIPFYPRCLQQAHEHAALVDFDLDILQDQVFDGIRGALGGEAPVLDALRLQSLDPATRRY
jgi:hypothetical protein